MQTSSIPSRRQGGPLPFASRRLRELLFPWLRPGSDADQRRPAPRKPVATPTNETSLRDATAFPVHAITPRKLTASDRGLLNYLIERALQPWMR